MSTELLAWNSADEVLPEAVIPVLIFNEAWPSDSIRLGYFDGGCWRDYDHVQLVSTGNFLPPTYWANRPCGPVHQSPEILSTSPSLAEQIGALDDTLYSLRTSFTIGSGNYKGQIVDPFILRQIECLEAIRRVLVRQPEISTVT